MPRAAKTRYLTLNEEESATVCVKADPDTGEFIVPILEVPCNTTNAVAFGPTAALLGTLKPDGTPNPLMWSSLITEDPKVGPAEIWEMYNFTEDAHPIHVHQVQFEVVNRQQIAEDEEELVGADRKGKSGPYIAERSAAKHVSGRDRKRRLEMKKLSMPPVQLVPGSTKPPEAWETGTKDTVIAYPGEVTRVKIRFTFPGLYVWHCHILEHEDNEMMRPYCATQGKKRPRACDVADRITPPAPLVR